MDMFGIAAFPAIIVLVTVVADAVKASKIPDEWIPVICAITGAILGVVGMMIIPEFPAVDYLTAAAVGAVSGFAAVGINQVEKQVVKNMPKAEPVEDDKEAE